MKKFILLLTFTVVGLMLTVNAAAETIVTDGLVSYWTFDRTNIHDGTVEDVWGENHATIVGDPKIAGGYLRQGILLDGVGDYVRLPNIGNFGSRVGTYTFEAWFKTSHKRSWSAIYNINEELCRTHHSGNGIIINAESTIGVVPIIPITKNKEDFIILKSLNNVKHAGCFGGRHFTQKLVTSDGEWHHIAYTSQKTIEPVDCVNRVFYFDGKRIASGKSCVFLNLNIILPKTKPIFLGAVNDQDKTFGFFQGIFDEVRIYDRALTHEEVIRNYESGIGLSVEPIEKLPTVWGALKAKR